MAAVLLARMQMFVRRMRQMAFMWATVVLLGGFVGEISSTDFGCISLLLLGWGIKNFHSHTFTFRSISFLIVFPLFSVITTAVIASFILVVIFAPWYAIVLYILLCVGALHVGEYRLTYTRSDREHLQFLYSYVALYFEIYLALGSCVVSVLRITKGHVYASENLQTAKSVFYIMVMVDSCGFLLSWLWWEVMAALRLSTSGATLLGDAKAEFYNVRYRATTRQGSMQGGDVNFPGFVTSEFLEEKRSGRKLMRSMTLLNSMCSSGFPWRDVLERQDTSGSSVVGSLEVVEHLFEITSQRFWMEHRLAALTLLSRLSEYPEALANMATVASLGDNIKQLVTALDTDVNRATLTLLRRLSALEEDLSSHAKVPGVMEDFDFTAEEQDSPSPRFHGTTVRCKVTTHAFGYLTAALCSESCELQTIALETLISLGTSRELVKHHHPPSRRLVERLFELLGVSDQAGELLELLAHHTTYQEVFMQLNSDSGCNMILGKLCNGLATSGSVQEASILGCLCYQLSQEQKDMIDVACLIKTLVRETAKGCKRLHSAMSLAAALIWSIDDGKFRARLGADNLLTQLAEALKTSFKGGNVPGKTIIRVHEDDGNEESIGLCMALLHKAPELTREIMSDEETRARVLKAAERERLTGVPRLYI